MRALIQQLAERSPDERATILMVGAGNGAELPLLRQLGAGRLVLAEAHPGLADALARRIDPALGEEVWPQAVTAEAAETATLYIVNNPGYSSLRPPSGLCEDFPNLRETRQTGVPARSLAKAIESLALDAGAQHLLILDAPGQAFDLLSATPHGVLQSFATIIVRCGVKPLYADDKRMEDVLVALGSIGFDAGAEDPEAIYPHAAVLLSRNDDRVERMRLEAMVGKLRAECEAQVLLASERAQEIGRLVRGRDFATKLAQKYKAELDAAVAEASRADEMARIGVEQQKLVAERDARIGQLTKELAAATQAATEQEKLATARQANFQKLAQERNDFEARYKAELDQAAKAAADLQKLANDRHVVIQRMTQELEAATRAAAEQERLAAARQANAQKLAQERDELVARHKDELDKAALTAAEQQKLANDRHALIQQVTRERDAAVAQLASARPEQDSLRAGIAALNQELADVRRTSSLSVRLQTLREADLKDLQARYQALREKNEDQHRLLVKLSERLTVAAEYFHELTLTQQATPVRDERVGKPVRAIRPPASRKSSGKRTEGR